MNWILLAILTAFFYGAYNIFIKLASGHINQIVGAVILQIVAALVGSLILIYLKLNHAPMEISRQGITLAIAAGVFVGLAEITSFFVFSKGASASAGIPIIIGGSVLFSALIGLLFLRESISVVQLGAIAFIVIGITLLSRS